MRVLLLGYTGKLGTAIKKSLEDSCHLICKNSSDFNAVNLEDSSRLVRSISPDVVINTVAFMGIDQCEKSVEKAFLVNAIFPGMIARLSADLGFKLMHFSTDAVFDGSSDVGYYEKDCPNPINVYGLTKYAGERMVLSEVDGSYVFRVPIMFGDSSRNDQFVEKMLIKVRGGSKELFVSDDIVASPSYSLDVAMAVKKILFCRTGFEPGVYHISNTGSASLYDLMSLIAAKLRLDVLIRRASHSDFPSVGKKNLKTVLKSEKFPAMRSWESAVAAFCDGFSD